MKQTFNRLLAAVKKNDAITVESILSANHALFSEQSRNYDTLLHRAAQYGAIDVIKFLIIQGANVNARNGDNYAPAHFAILSGNLEALQVLMAYGAQINLRTSEGDTLLHLAAGAGHVEMVDFLINQGIDAAITNIRGLTAEDMARVRDDEAIVTLLQGYVNSRRTVYDTPPRVPSLQTLALVCLSGLPRNKIINLSHDLHNRYRIVREAAIQNRFVPDEYIASDPVLVESYLLLVDLKESDLKKEIIEALFKHAIAASSVEGVVFLLAHGIDRDTDYTDKKTPLHLAAEVGEHEIVQLLIEHGFGINERTETGQTPLDFALRHGEDNLTVQTLRSQGGVTSAEIAEREEHAREEQRDREERLITFAAVGDTAGVQQLLDQGVNINAQNESGYTALMLAARNGYHQMVRFLLDHGAQSDIERVEMFGGQAHFQTALTLVPNLLSHRGITTLLQQYAIP
jgi:ankyrin repeat protein